MVILLEEIKQHSVQTELLSEVKGVNFVQMGLILVEIVDYSQTAHTSDRFRSLNFYFASFEIKSDTTM